MEGGYDVLEVAHTCEIVELAEADVHIQTILFVDPLQEASIHVAQLLHQY